MNYSEFLKLKDPYNYFYDIWRNGKVVWRNLTANEVTNYKNNTDENFLMYRS